MPDLLLTRFCRSDLGTFGRMMVDEAVLYTVERPWLDNRPRVSCIPAGDYRCRPREFFRGGYPAVQVVDVPGRSYILFHKANWPDDVEGCIGVGTRWGCLNGRVGVVNSAAGFARFMEAYGGREFSLRVEWAVAP